MSKSVISECLKCANVRRVPNVTSARSSVAPLPCRARQPFNMSLRGRRAWQSSAKHCPERSEGSSSARSFDCLLTPPGLPYINPRIPPPPFLKGGQRGDLLCHCEPGGRGNLLTPPLFKILEVTLTPTLSLDGEGVLKVDRAPVSPCKGEAPCSYPPLLKGGKGGFTLSLRGAKRRGNLLVPLANPSRAEIATAPLGPRDDE
jgi:hypothetical protein